MRISGYRQGLKQPPVHATDTFLLYAKIVWLCLESFHQTNPLDKLNSQVETDFNRSGRIDAPRAYSATQRWLESDQKYKLWLKNQEGAEFIRKVPLTMVNNYAG